MAAQTDKGFPVYVRCHAHWRMPRTQNSELRTQNYLFDLIHLHFCYNNTIQYNTVQFIRFLYSFWSRRLPLRSDKITGMGATFYRDLKQ